MSEPIGDLRNITYNTGVPQKVARVRLSIPAMRDLGFHEDFISAITVLCDFSEACWNEP